MSTSTSLSAFGTTTGVTGPVSIGVGSLRSALMTTPRALANAASRPGLVEASTSHSSNLTRSEVYEHQSRGAKLAPADMRTISRSQTCAACARRPHEVLTQVASWRVG